MDELLDDGGFMKESDIASHTLASIEALLSKMPTKQSKSEALSGLLMVSYKLLRTMEGDEFVRGFLESSLHEVNSSAPDMVLRQPH